MTDSHSCPTNMRTTRSFNSSSTVMLALPSSKSYSNKAKDEKEWKKNMLDRSMGAIFDPPQLSLRDLKAQIRSDLCRVINAMSPYEVLMNAPFHETPATSDLLDCDLKYDADTLEHSSSPFGYEGPECSFSSLF